MFSLHVSVLHLSAFLASTASAAVEANGYECAPQVYDGHIKAELLLSLRLGITQSTSVSKPTFPLSTKAP